MVDMHELLTGYIHEGKQFAPDGSSAVLTVKRIGRLSAGGALDFGGSEYAEAEVSWIEPQKQSAEDKYGWWKLSQGHYRIEINESVSVPEDQPTALLLHPWPDAVRAGVNHPSEVITDSREPLFTHIGVGPQGISIKENARLGRLSVLG
jgi:hypothetical protein